jgi:hypothetical protein
MPQPPTSSRWLPKPPVISLPPLEPFSSAWWLAVEHCLESGCTTWKSDSKWPSPAARQKIKYGRLALQRLQQPAQANRRRQSPYAPRHSGNAASIAVSYLLWRRTAEIGLVHHVNGDRTDDRLENLMPISLGAHRCEHTRSHLAFQVCANCWELFVLPKPAKRTWFCSRRCTGVAIRGVPQHARRWLLPWVVLSYKWFAQGRPAPPPPMAKLRAKKLIVARVDRSARSTISSQDYRLLHA